MEPCFVSTEDQPEPAAAPAEKDASMEPCFVSTEDP